MNRVLAYGIVAGIASVAGAGTNEPAAFTTATNTVRIMVLNRSAGSIDSRLFGHFLEKPVSNEVGPEAAMAAGTNALRTNVVAMMRQMRIPIIRFPGGTHVDYTDWRDMIDHVPGRSGGRPLTADAKGEKTNTNRFGLDEYFALRDELECETILVVNLLDGLSRKVPLAAAAVQAAGMVAYANAPVGAALPEGMPDWPSIRKQNGHEAPFGAEYIQFGNEWWMDGFQRQVVQGTGLTNRTELAAWYRECLTAYIRAIRAVDPQIGIILDGRMGYGAEPVVLGDAYVRSNVTFVAFHSYAPGLADIVNQGRQRVKAEEMSPEDLWNAWATMPGGYSDGGECVALGNAVTNAVALGYGVACTEWNWNGWGFPRNLRREELDWRVAAGVGVGGFLNGLMRSGGTVRIGCQSMLVGTTWNITGIRVDPGGLQDPYMFPQAQVTSFYAAHHGEEGLQTALMGHRPAFEQPYRIGWGTAHRVVLYQDVVASRTGGKVFVHMVNRYFKQNQPVTVDVSQIALRIGSATYHRLVERPLSQREHVVFEEVTDEVATAGTSINLVLPARSISILEVDIPPESLLKHEKRPPAPVRRRVRR